MVFLFFVFFFKNCLSPDITPTRGHGAGGGGGVGRCCVPTHTKSVIIKFYQLCPYVVEACMYTVGRFKLNPGLKAPGFKSST